MENQTESRKNQGDHIVQIRSCQKNRTQPKTVWWHTKSLSLSEIYRNNFRLSTGIPKTLSEHPTSLQHQVQPIKTTGQPNLKCEPSPSTIIQIYKQCVQAIFEYGSISTITTSDISSPRFNGSKTNLFGLPFVYQNTPVLSYSMTPLAFHMWRIDSSHVQRSPQIELHKIL